jgi:beta-N-acetylhexosaminidase
MVALTERGQRRPGRLLVATGGLAGLGLLFIATQLRSPLLLKVRGSALWLWLLGGLLLAGLAARALQRGPSRRQRVAAAALLLGAVAALLVGGLGQRRDQAQLRTVRAAPLTERAALARHLVAGFRSWDEARVLVDEVLVGGVYVGLHNARGLSADQLRERIAELRARRAARGLSPLIVAVDQEGGPVSRLSPPLMPQPALAAVIADADSPAERDRRVRAFASEQAAALRALGANVNFSPVVDLRLHPQASALDRYSFIGARAISAEPPVVAAVARTYAAALLAGGLVPTAKHFPGLGRVRTDTHFFTATLATPVAELEATDWLPFRAILGAAPTLLMLGHVRLAALDPDHLAASSAPLLRDIVRGQWGHKGVLITDDLCMSPVFYGPGGLPGFAVAALRASVDLLLISYDGTQVYAALAALLQARRQGELPDEVLQPSAQRLDRLDTFLSQPAPAPPSP